MIAYAITVKQLITRVSDHNFAQQIITPNSELYSFSLQLWVRPRMVSVRLTGHVFSGYNRGRKSAGVFPAAVPAWGCYRSGNARTVGMDAFFAGH